MGEESIYSCSSWKLCFVTCCFEDSKKLRAEGQPHPAPCPGQLSPAPAVARGALQWTVVGSRYKGTPPVVEVQLWIPAQQRGEAGPWIGGAA